MTCWWWGWYMVVCDKNLHRLLSHQDASSIESMWQGVQVVIEQHNHEGTLAKCSSRSINCAQNTMPILYSIAASAHVSYIICGTLIYIIFQFLHALESFRIDSSQACIRTINLQFLSDLKRIHIKSILTDLVKAKAQANIKITKCRQRSIGGQGDSPHA